MTKKKRKRKEKMQRPDIPYNYTPILVSTTCYAEISPILGLPSLISRPFPVAPPTHTTTNIKETFFQICSVY